MNQTLINDNFPKHIIDKLIKTQKIKIKHVQIMKKFQLIISTETNTVIKKQMKNYVKKSSASIRIP